MTLLRFCTSCKQRLDGATGGHSDYCTAPYRGWTMEYFGPGQWIASDPDYTGEPEECVSAGSRTDLFAEIDAAIDELTWVDCIACNGHGKLCGCAVGCPHDECTVCNGDGGGYREREHG